MRRDQMKRNEASKTYPHPITPFKLGKTCAG